MESVPAARRVQLAKRERWICIYTQIPLYIPEWGRAYPCSRHRPTEASVQSDSRLEHRVFEWMFRTFFKLEERCGAPTRVVPFFVHVMRFLVFVRRRRVAPS